MKKFLMCLMTVVLLLSMATVGVSAQDDKLMPALSETDNGANGWYVGTNIDVELLGDGAFSIGSIDGTATAANIAWAFTYAQLKETPYLNVNIGNEQSAANSPYMKMYFTAGTAATFTVAPYQDSALENWVRSGAVAGANCINLKEAVDAAAPSLTDNDVIFMFLYHDPFGTGEALVVDELFLSDGRQGGGDQGGGGKDERDPGERARHGQGHLWREKSGLNVKNSK